MKSVKAIFEGSLHAEVNSDGNVEFGNSDASFAPADILKSDLVIYSAEYRAWLNDSWLPKNRHGLERILKGISINPHQPRKPYKIQHIQ